MFRLTIPLLAATLLAGCFSRAILPERPIHECREEPVLCKPGRFDQITLDTSRISYTALTRTESRLAIDRVEGLDGVGNEFGVSFGRSGGEGFATIRGTSEALHRVRFRDADDATLEGIVDVRGLSSPYGSAARASRGDSLWLTARLAGNVKGDYDIFEATATSRGVGSPARLEASAPVGWDAQPAISPDGLSLYFVSDRRGGFGGTDIYVIRRTADGWSAPRNLGAGINTPCDELSPFVSGNGRWLYFSSSGHATVGGYDIFRSPVLGEQLGAVENLGRPINTAADEIFPSAPAEASTDTLLYYSSNQRGGKAFDMYVLHRLVKRTGGGPIAQTERERQRERERERASNRDLIDSITVEGRVRTPDGQPVDGALVTIEEGDPPHRDSTRTDPNGRYRFPIEEGRTYDITAGPEGRLPGNRQVYVPPSNRNPVTNGDIVLPDTVTFRVNFPFNNATDPYEFTLDDRGLPTAERWTDVVERLARFLRSTEGNSGRIEIVGHTDPVGSDPFNLDLGRRRAEFVRRELVRRGVRASVLLVRSEGEGSPLPAQMEEPEELYHARLRRVELVRK